MKLCLEVSAINGVHREFRESVIARCISTLEKTTDAFILISTIRCMVSINEAIRIPLSILQTAYQSKNSTLKAAAGIAMASAAKYGAKLPIDLLDLLTGKMDNDSIAAIIVTMACNNEEAAAHILNILAYGKRPSNEIVLRIMIQSAKYPALFDTMRIIMSKIAPVVTSGDALKTVRKLNEIINVL